MNRRKVVIIDDELPALQVLETILGKRPDLEIVLSTTDYQAAFDYLDENDVDLLIGRLDLRVASGYDLLAGVEPPTQIIVCTGSKDEGSESLLNGAIDFVVKLVEEDRLNFAVDRALRQLQLLEFERESKHYPSTVALQLQNSQVFVNVRTADLVFAQADGKCTRLFLANGEDLLARKLIRDLQNELNPVDFIRSHRSIVVNRLSIERYELESEHALRKWIVKLRKEVMHKWANDNEKGQLPVGGKYRYRVEKALGIR